MNRPESRKRKSSRRKKTEGRGEGGTTSADAVTKSTEKGKEATADIPSPSKVAPKRKVRRQPSWKKYRIAVGSMSILYGLAMIIPTALYSVGFFAAAAAGAILGMLYFCVAVLAFLSAVVMFFGGFGLLNDPPKGVRFVSMASVVLTAASVMFFFVSVFTLYPPITGIVIYLLISCAGATPPILTNQWCASVMKKMPYSY